jgi:hypothetical protein
MAVSVVTAVNDSGERLFLEEEEEERCDERDTVIQFSRWWCRTRVAVRRTDARSAAVSAVECLPIHCLSFFLYWSSLLVFLLL